MSQHHADGFWAGYYQALAGRGPRPLLLDALDWCYAPSTSAGRLAIDLGSGDGTETLELLRRGWRVLAIDQEPEAMARLERAVPPEHRQWLQTQVVGFSQVVLPAADLLYAGLSLPFCHPEDFDALWRKVTAAVRPGGCFAGHFFGERDGWAGRTAMTFHSLAQVRALLRGFEVVQLREQDEHGPSYAGPKHWHVFHVIAITPQAAEGTGSSS
jgi:tellurite methyltransferase